MSDIQCAFIRGTVITGLRYTLCIGGPAQSFPPVFFSGGRPNFSKLSEEQKKQTDRVTTQGSFFDNLVIALPDARHFDGDPQLRWEIRLKIGDRHRMLNLFQHAVTIAFFCFFCSSRLASKITRFCSYFYQYRHDINKNMIPLAPPLQEGMGEAFLAPQGAPSAPPSHEGMGEASLAPQGAAS